MHPVPPTNVWVVRLRAAAEEVEAVALELRRAGRDVGLRGAAGTALQDLVDDVAGELRGLAASFERAAAPEHAVERWA
jgi:hypothetical protein